MSGPTVSIRPARSYKAAADILSKRDPVLRRLVAQAGPVRVNPPAETHFAALVRAILYQQLAGAAARAIHGRLIAALGGEVTPERFLSLSSQTRQPSHIGTAAGGNTPGLSPLSPVAVPLWAHPRHQSLSESPLSAIMGHLRMIRKITTPAGPCLTSRSTARRVVLAHPARAISLRVVHRFAARGTRWFLGLTFEAALVDCWLMCLPFIMNLS